MDVTRRLTQLLWTLPILLVTTSLAAAPAVGTTPGSNGRIAFSADFGQGYEVYTVRPNGSGIRQLTQEPRDATNPDWSPDGRWITFGIESEEHEGIGLMTRNGHHRRDLTPHGFQLQPAFTPDGDHIVFVGNARRHPSVAIMRLDATHRRQLTDPPRRFEGDTDPNVSPDGRIISFVRVKVAEEKQALFTIHRDGTHLHRITPYGFDVAVKHDWAPDGRHLVFSRNVDHPHADQPANVMTIRPDGSGLTNVTKLTDPDTTAFAGSYSPDGRWIAYRIEDANGATLHRIRPDGTHDAPILQLPVPTRFIDWGPRPR